MRLFTLFLLAFAAGCAGNVADYIGPRAGIVTPQLIRFGLDLAESRCVGERIGGALSPLALRRLVRAASIVRRGALGGDRLVPQDLLLVAGTLRDGAVRGALAQAFQTCRMDATRIAGGIVPVDVVPPMPAAPPAPPAAAWLNLGAASSGQSIAIDASTLEQDTATRTAWFRLTDPGAGPGFDSYLLKIDCRGRTINARARRRRDAAGAVTEQVDYPDNPVPVENGTVMEIAWLAMCT